VRFSGRVDPAVGSGADCDGVRTVDRGNRVDIGTPRLLGLTGFELAPLIASIIGRRRLPIACCRPSGTAGGGLGQATEIGMRC